MVDKCEQLYLQLQETIDKVPNGDMIVVMGDFNARVGAQEHITVPHVVGPYAVDVKNENGIILIDACLTNDIVISNTYFRHKLVHKTSWKLDYTLVKKKFRSSIEAQLELLALIIISCDIKLNYI